MERHIPHSAVYCLKCAFDDTLPKLSMNRGLDCIAWTASIGYLKLPKRWILTWLIFYLWTHSLLMKREFYNSTNGHVCKQPFAPTDVKRRDHCHFTNKYRSVAHEGCSFNCTKSHKILIDFHTPSGYDSHFLIKSLPTQFDGGVNLLSVNKETYISFTNYVTDAKVNLRFIDSFRFIASKS